MSLVRLLYRSDSELTGTDRTARDTAFVIADAASIRNEAIGISGALMFTRAVFVQLIEGDAVAIEDTFERICRDSRHRHVVLLDYSEADHRVFEGLGLIAFEGDQRVRGLFPKVGESVTYARRSGLSAKAAIELMQTLYRKRSGIQRDKSDTRLVATDIMR